MSDEKHTPGPWEVYQPEPTDLPGIEAEGLSIVVFGDPKDHIDQDTGVGIHGQDPQEAIANARLIAAAPDLLEALEDLLAACDGLNAAGHNAPAFGIPDKARAAIAKAKGEQA